MDTLVGYGDTEAKARASLWKKITGVIRHSEVHAWKLARKSEGYDGDLQSWLDRPIKETRK